MSDMSTVMLRLWGLMERLFFLRKMHYLLILRKLQKLNASVSQHLLFRCLLWFGHELNGCRVTLAVPNR